MLADVDRALDQLSLEERLAVIYFLTIYEGKKPDKAAAAAMEAIDKMVVFLQ